MEIMISIIKELFEEETHSLQSKWSQRVSGMEEKEKVRRIFQKEQQLQVPEAEMILACLKDRIKAPILVA